MARRSAGFVSKKPHKKSRGGCSTCKKKKVKCDEGIPACSYCAVRKLDCNYPPDPKDSDGSISTSPPISETNSKDDVTELINFNETVLASPESPFWMVPALQTSAGQLTYIEMEYLHHYKQNVWQTMSYREGDVVHALNREWAPRESISKEYLLYTLLTISAHHSQVVRKDPKAQGFALQFRERALGAYTKALSTITSETYETILMTALYMMAMVPPPELHRNDAAFFTWFDSLFHMMQGLRILAGLKWAAGIEKLTVYPIFRREIKTLPPPPMLSLPPDPRFWVPDRDPSDDPMYPNPPGTYRQHDQADNPPSPPPQSSGFDLSNLPFRPQELMSASKTNPHDTPASWKKPNQWELPLPAFLPPPLMALLRSLVEPSLEPGGGIDVQAPVLLPAIHALTPIFLSLYYFHLDTDFYIRTFVLPTFLTPDFFKLVSAREPRSLILVGWWFAFIKLIPDVWWLDGPIPRVMQAISNEVMRHNNKMLMDAIEGAYRIVRDVYRKGRLTAAKGVFDGWDGVIWSEGPEREERWRDEERAKQEMVSLGWTTR